ncbi:MAG: radical SAM family heme chaperone HemW [Bryobacteraceae bacterium]
MAGVYISFPFCAQKCTFCNFASGVFARGLEERYLAALPAEIAAFPWPWTPETVYLGGGTPSRIPEAALASLLALIPGRPWKEATIEAAPGSLTREKARAWAEAGLNRVSLGVQSFVREEIARTGRRHTAEIVAGEVALLAQHGIANFNIDLIAGLPHQTAASWRESLAWVERIEAPHASVYMFEVDQDSRLGAEMLRGGSRYGAAAAPSEEQTVEFYEAAIEDLAAAGLRQYEISNFARPGFESLHNLKYWRREPYAGFGSDAHSFDGALRRRNAEPPEEYTGRIERGESPCVETLPAQADEEALFLGLRLREGVRPTRGQWARFGAPIRRFIQAGLLESDGATLRLTRRGVLLSNEVFQEFVA